jgi:uncharacterized protein (UPF0548 family)
VLDERLARTSRAQAALAQLAGRSLNFEPAELAGASAQDGWHIDDYRQPLPSEPPGEPVAGASFEVAQRLMTDYAFADPAVVRAVYDPAAGLANRNMLLQVRFGPMRFFFGCRVGAVTDETRTVDGRRVRVWGWSYGTLEGHVERGQMDWTVWKWLDDGAVEFRVHVVSRRARVRNPIVRLGFRLVGRRQQTHFARRACARMAELVPRELGRPRSARADERGATQLGAQRGAIAQEGRGADRDEGHLAPPHPEQQLPR